ncbi:MAG: hypothetical protein EpisKO_41270 [Epibacterium sp.]
MLNFHKEAEAQEKLLCPLARTFGFEAGELSEHCRGRSCAFWRWRPFMVNDPGYKEAVAAARRMPKAELGGEDPAVFVNKNRAKFDLPEEPFLGYCGAGGEPMK